jgi:sulfur transfer complex TusBCD TusB component (DsrH family)
MPTETTKEDKIVLLENDIHAANNTIYIMGHRAQAARIVKNDEHAKAAEEEIAKQLGIIDYFKKQLEEVRKESPSESAGS